MLDKKIVDLINSQINKEFYSSFLYMDMANFYTDESLNGFANWFNIQTQEEYAHAMLFIQYLQLNGEKVVLEAIAKPTGAYKNHKAPLTEAYEHELFVTKSINDIYAVAFELKDFKTMQFLDWFVKEQAEEEQNVDELCKRYDLFGADARALYMLDQELGARVYSPPSLVV
ncbi:MAG: ferritin [Bacteroidales bacterium 36-12]|nr:MAG: ferritin [Bacteroidales bacterium 36-12]